MDRRERRTPIVVEPVLWLPGVYEELFPAIGQIQMQGVVGVAAMQDFPCLVVVAPHPKIAIEFAGVVGR